MCRIGAMDRGHVTSLKTAITLVFNNFCCEMSYLDESVLRGLSRPFSGGQNIKKNIYATHEM
jgi:hypothetical protein